MYVSIYTLATLLPMLLPMSLSTFQPEMTVQDLADKLEKLGTGRVTEANCHGATSTSKVPVASDS